MRRTDTKTVIGETTPIAHSAIGDGTNVVVIYFTLKGH